MELHPVMYVRDQYAEREFYELLGFERVYEGDEFPGFLAVGRGSAVFGLQRASTEQPPYAGGLRWQFAVESPAALEQIIEICRSRSLAHEVVAETGGTRFRARIVKVRSPAGVLVWFEGPNEIPDQPGEAR